MRKMLLTVLIGFLSWSIEGEAQNCRDLNIDGNWSAKKDQIFAGYWTKLTITQSGCYVLIQDNREKAIWKIDLSGTQVTRVPKEIVHLNQRASGPVAAQNISDLEFKFGPGRWWPEFQVTADISLSQHSSFPFAMQASLEAEIDVRTDDSCIGCRPGEGTIRIRPSKILVTDISHGLPSSMDKASFIEGMNSVLQFAGGLFWYNLTVLELERD